MVDTSIDITLNKDITNYISECMKEEHSESSLINVLHKIQGEYGYLSNHHMQEVAELMEIPASKISGVATFYHYFRLVPQGKYMIQFCMGTACYVNGGDKIVEAFKDELGIDLGETTTDGFFSLELTRCLGVCGLAPVIRINDDVLGAFDPATVGEVILNLRKNDK